LERKFQEAEDSQKSLTPNLTKQDLPDDDHLTQDSQDFIKLPKELAAEEAKRLREEEELEVIPPPRSPSPNRFKRLEEESEQQNIK
jgi:hypothetical protein